MWASLPGCSRTDGRCRRVIGFRHRTQIGSWRVPSRAEGGLPFFFRTFAVDTLQQRKPRGAFLLRVCLENLWITF